MSEFIKIKEVAEVLGVTETTIYNWMKEKIPIPHYKKHGATRFVKDEVVKWFKSK